jgi:hypothetical protein
MTTNTMDGFDIIKLNIEIDSECPVCKLVMNDDDYKLSCKHIFCVNCICKLLEQTANSIKCPLCRTITIVDNNDIMNLNSLRWSSKLSSLIQVIGLFDIYMLMLCIFEIYVIVKISNFLNGNITSTWILTNTLTTIDIFIFLSLSGLLGLYRTKIITNKLATAFIAISMILILQSVEIIFVISLILAYYSSDTDHYVDAIRANVPEHWILMIIHVVTICIVFGSFFLENIFCKQCLRRDNVPSVYTIIMSQKSTQEQKN